MEEKTRNYTLTLILNKNLYKRVANCVCARYIHTGNEQSVHDWIRDSIREFLLSDSDLSEIFELKKIQLRIPEKDFSEVKNQVQDLSSKLGPCTITKWVLSAVQEKLQKEEVALSDILENIDNLAKTT